MFKSDAILERLAELHPRKIDLSLDRMYRILERLGNPQLKLPPVVHIAGTNGKGSTAAYLRAMHEAAGHGVHVYTSPHLVRFHERVRLADPAGGSTYVPEAELAAALEECETANGGEPITIFEITTAAAFLIFSRHPADILLLEVGLGGRLDATNVVDNPVATVITPISMDHAAYLGDTIELIAAEKAGIIKQGVPCVVSAQPRAVEAVIARAAARLRAPLSISGQDWHVGEERGRLVYQDESGLMDLPLPRLVGRHQFENAGTAIATLRYLPTTVDEKAIATGMQTVEWPARLQPLTSGPIVEAAPPGAEIWLDGGHNPAAGEVLGAALAELEDRNPRPLYLIAGMLTSKDASGFFHPFEGLAREVITVPIPDVEASFDPSDLAADAARAGLTARIASSVEDALQSLPRGEAARILICGSLYLAGHVLKIQETVPQ
ncbi:bifunctional folylpolyglutamate synthase/dihydrofolate synthase [Microbaculum marinisediminis]|uniref:Dihydrofolate synthase/folylpolyglutamate synthase n=1 Tax=Microbaculum marinisediminis TaxID=2931392 RepID=A0AAW5R006_9HYPH|nr:folylpolyglutamate synthase/dihydrofolate synthase family protein [Microbaculum sp. A6E488]MCT8973293.1 bifunctional folylpolyglutamate synthase/dihydrofolate synthase [Microbaculum sp. A6E488]